MRLAMLAFLAALLLLAAFTLHSSAHSYAFQDRDSISAPASRANPAGTDELGRDRAVRLAMALLLGLGGSCAASAVSSSLALALGCGATAGPGWLRRVLLFGGDLFLTVPWIFLLMLVRSALPLNVAPLASGLITFLLLAILGAPVFLRMHHERTARLLRADWVLSAQAAGLRPSQMARHLLPHVRPLLWTQFLLYLPACLAAEANLGTLGLGLNQPLPSLGNFLADLQGAVLLGGSRLVFLPIAVLIAALIALELSIFGAEQ